MNAAPNYRWTCHKCSAANPPAHPRCAQCGFPAVASGQEILGEDKQQACASGEESLATEVLVRATHAGIGTAIIVIALISAARSSGPAPWVVAIMIAIGLVPIAIAFYGNRKLAFRLLRWNSR